MDDPIEDGQAWAQRQQAAFPQWVTCYGGGVADLWDFGLDSLDRMTYIVFGGFSTPQAIDDPANAGFSGAAAWYLGEIVRRRDPKKRRWARCDYGYDAGDYVVEPVAKTHRWWKNPRGDLRAVARAGDPMWLRSSYTYYVAPLWDKPWPAWIHSSETGSWRWDEAANRWWSQRDQWIYSIAGLLALLTARQPDVVLDYSTASLHTLEGFVVNDSVCQDPLIRDAITAYVGECLLRVGGGKWIWDVHPEHLTNGFPVVRRSIGRVSPAHLIDYALARRDGQTFTRIHCAWIAEAEDCRRRGPGYVLGRELTPGLDSIRQRAYTVKHWADLKQAQFADWVAAYGVGRQWDFSAGSLEGLAQVILEHCAPGTFFLDAECGDDFIDGAVWYFGETLHRAIPSRWSFTASNAERTGEGRHGLTIAINDLYEAYEVSYPSAVYLVQELDRVLRPWGYTGKPEASPDHLRHMYELWATTAIRHRIEKSQRRREAVKRRAGRRRSDREVLECWLAERQDEFLRWIAQFGSGQEWDFSVDSLDALEVLIRQVASGPEELLEDKVNADFFEGAAWYLGEVTRRQAPDAVRWDYDRTYLADPHLSGCYHVHECLAEVYAKEGGVLRAWHEKKVRLIQRSAAAGDGEVGRRPQVSDIGPNH
ncbi:hypothetical protein F0Q45_12720 [Mycobacterium simiae]|uniref:Uncharacterized protein n=1 Tax=Mycobacterium simiae TaxID=1784 RepID=A0A5B1BP50_MYCSI|nr:hypothetical protein [Mycobacterium simiae]KAA1249862.1 hypothetical protein F0Q45_12720 [Mycobacterium simiae]